MRMAADEYGVEHRRREDVIDDLRKQRQLLRDSPPFAPENVVAAEHHMPAVRWPQSGKCHQRQRFAGSVLTKDRYELAVTDVQIKFIDK